MMERILVVGFGSIGKRHARLARTLLPNVKIAVLRRASCDDADPAFETGSRCVTSLDEALDFAPQAAVIANPSTHHLAVAQRLANAGVHLLIEKPIANTSEGVQSLIDAGRSKGIVLMTGYNLRFVASLVRFRELLQTAVVGRVLSVRAEIGQYLPLWRPGTDYRESVSARAALGGGVLLELSHELDYLRWIFGEVSWVHAVECRRSNLKIDVEDTAHLLLGFNDYDAGDSLVATLSMDFVRHDTTRVCTVIGECGSLRWNAIDGTVQCFQEGASAWETIFSHSPTRDESYLLEWREFFDRIADHAEPAVSGHDGLAVLKIIEAARASIATEARAEVNRE